MNDTAAFAHRLRTTTVSLLVCAALVAICYFFVDRPFAIFIHDHKVATEPIIPWLTYPPPILQAWFVVSKVEIKPAPETPASRLLQ